ncbi:MAG: TerB family tellurite resistance protein [Polyangiaceae bacterium]|nr:TerB family tellurite resistance protein [Polyangiaceae bacterium]
MSVDIGRDSVLALCAVAWADGVVDPAESAGIRDAARQLGLSAEDSALVEQALGRAFDLSEVETIRMSRLTRLFTYAAGYWIASVDGALSAQETQVLGLLGDRLGLSQVARERAAAVVTSSRDAGAQSGQPFDLQKLRSRLSAGLSQIGDE